MSLPPASSRSLASLAGLLCLFAPWSARAGSDDFSAQTQALFQRCSKAVVKIEADDDDGRLSGSGFFVDPDGTIFTCYSVGGESRDIVVSNGQVKYPATRIAADPRSGLAILKIEAAAKTPFLPLGKSGDLSVAALLMTIGYPADMPVTPNVGCVGGFGISYGTRFFAVSQIRANIPVQRGEGGAPLLDMRGNVVGVLVSSLEGGAGCFALPIEAAAKVRSDVMRFGEVRPGWLGIKIAKAGQNPGVEVQGFSEDSPAARTSLLPGDVLKKIGDRPVETPEDVLNAAFYLTAGDPVSLTVERAGQTLDVKVQPARNPLAPKETAALPPQFDFSMQMGQ